MSIEIITRRISVYTDAVIRYGDVSLDLGLMDENECVIMACKLLFAAEDLLPLHMDEAISKIQATRLAIEEL